MTTTKRTWGGSCAGSSRTSSPTRHAVGITSLKALRAEYKAACAASDGIIAQLDGSTGG